MIIPGMMVEVWDASFAMFVGDGYIDVSNDLAVNKLRELKVLATNCILPGETLDGEVVANDTIVQNLKTEEIFFTREEFLQPKYQKEKGTEPSYVTEDGKIK